MKKLIVSLMIAAGVYGCASSTATNKVHLSTNNYQQHVVDSMDYMDNFAEFDEKDFPKATLDTKDFSVLLQAEVAYNQGSYDAAAKVYYDLANKYKDPRIVYKAIVCYQHVSTMGQDFTKLNQMIELLVKIAPNSDIAKLYSIQNDLNTANYDHAVNTLDILIKQNKDHARDILLFVTTLLSTHNYPLNQATITNFGDYVLNKYSKYPEGYLLASVAYSDTNNQEKLLAVIAQIEHKYPTWEFPVFWNAGVLVNAGNSPLLGALIDQEIATRKMPTVNMENLCVSVLIKLNRIDDAEKYVDNSPNYKSKAPNMQVNKAVIDYKQGKLDAAAVELQQAKKQDYSLDGAIDFAIGGILSVEGEKNDALPYFKDAATSNPTLAPLAGVGVIRAYLAESNFAASDSYIESMAFGANNTAKASKQDLITAKLTIYTQLQQYDYAYKLAAENSSLYAKDKSFPYLHASLAGLSGHTTDAISLYKKYIKANPKDPSGYNDLGYLLADKTSNYKEALKYANKAYAMSPNDPAVLDTLGWANYKAKQYTLAEKYTAQAYKLSQDPDTAGHLKQIYLAEGKTSQANSLNVPDVKAQQQLIDQQLLDQGMLVLMYYQFGSDLGKK